MASDVVINNLANLIGSKLDKLITVLDAKPQFTRKEELVLRLLSSSLSSGTINAESDLEEIIDIHIEVASILDTKLQEIGK